MFSLRDVYYLFIYLFSNSPKVDKQTEPLVPVTGRFDTKEGECAEDARPFRIDIKKTREVEVMRNTD